MTSRPFSLILDFDSTIVQAEALDILPQISLPAGSAREQTLSKVADITNQGMEGKITIFDSLSARLKLLHAHREHIPPLILQLKNALSPSMRAHIEFFSEHRNSIYVITSGFEEYVVPVCAELGVLPSHVFANRFLFNSEGWVVGFDETRLPAQPQGKTAQLKALHPPSPIIAVGDGMTDLEMKHGGLVHAFVAYVETVRREVVVLGADCVANNFTDVIRFIDSL